VDCYQDNYTKEGELDISGLKKICRNFEETMSSWGAKLKVELTGGEPLIKNEIWELLGILNDADYVSETGIITNGTLAGDYINEISRFNKLRTVFVSLDGTSAKINDSIRGNGTFDKTVKNIAKLTDSDIPVIIMFTVMKENLKNAAQMIDFARELGTDGLIIERFIPLGQGKKIINSVIDSRDMQELYKEVCRKCDADYDPNEMFRYRALQVEFIKNGSTMQLYGAECVVGRDGMALLPDGTVHPCRRFNIPIGNMLNESLKTIWENSEVLNKIRNRANLKGGCFDCGITECSGCRAMTYALTGDYLAEDPHCFKDRD
jgi:radical SAM protein with 4Fe4S-binding SPASM domain